jgi:DNA-binding transcriptional regulator YdaS (Cro superfamily)
MKQLTPDDRRRIGAKVNVQATSLLQSLNGQKPLSPKKCVAIEDKSGGELKRWDLRPGDWHLIWPELVGKKGAPKVPAQADKAEA